MPNYYDNPDDYQRYCPFWGALEQHMSTMFQPNPWLFESAYQPIPGKQRFFITFRNFDRSDHYTVEYDHNLPGDHFRFP